MSDGFLKLIDPGPATLIDKCLFDPLTPTIFHQGWWLDIASKNNYQIVEVAGKNGQIIGRLPFFSYKTLGMTLCVNPPLTHFLGPAIDAGEGDVNDRAFKVASITKQLLEQLPSSSSYRFKCHRGVTDTIAFQKENFLTSVQFTHEIAPAPEQQLWQGLHSKRKSAIAYARNRLSLSDSLGTEDFIRFSEENLRERKLKSYLGLRSPKPIA